jgi:hypothetical protein
VDGMFIADPIVALVRQHGDDHRSLRQHLDVLLRTALLIPEIPEERILAAVKEELDFLTDEARNRVARLARGGAHHDWYVRALAALDPGTCVYPRADVDALRTALPDVPALVELRACLDHADARHRDLERRVAAMLRPPDPDELTHLDPQRDCAILHTAVSYHFRSERVFFGVLEEIRPLIAPQANLFFFSTGEFGLRTYKRLLDTVLLFDNIHQWGPESLRGSTAAARINAIHGRYNLPNDAFKWVLLNLVFVPVLWNQRLGWRPFSELERLGWFHEHIRVGRLMHITGLSDDYSEMHQWWQDASRATARPSEITRSSFEKLTAQLMEPLPEAVRPHWLTTLLVGMDDDFRRACDYPEPDPATVATVRETLGALGRLGAFLPKVPWIRSLQSSPVYPHGARVDELGVYRRGHTLPRPAWDKDPHATPPPESHGRNHGYPDGMQPMHSAAEIPDLPLPTLTWDEVARHATADDAWLVIDGDVVDVTAFLAIHPGGRKPLLMHAGKDASAAFARIGHSEAARILMSNFRIGRVAPRGDA